jgi:hypothetical protein
VKPQNLRRLGACATVVYALPFFLSLLTHIAHDLYHLREHLGHAGAKAGLAAAATGHFVHPAEPRQLRISMSWGM